MIPEALQENLPYGLVWNETQAFTTNRLCRDMACVTKRIFWGRFVNTCWHCSVLSLFTLIPRAF
jgi:hypothetical protein